MAVSIRPLTIEDTENIVSWRNNKDVLDNFIDQRHITNESHKKYYETRIKTGLVKQFIIVCDNTDVGTIFLTNLDMESKEGEYGIFIGNTSFRGKGIGYIASKLLLEYGFNELKLKKIVLRVLQRNTKAIKSYINIGFKFNGKYEDLVINDILERVLFMEIKNYEYEK